MNKQAEFQPFLDKYQDKGKFVKKAVKFDEKVREFTAVTNQLSTEIGQLEKALSDAMERRNKAEGKKNKAEKAKETAVVKEQMQKINSALSAPDVMVLDEKNPVSLSVMGRGITNIPQEIKMQVGLLSTSLSVERELRSNEQMYGSGKNIQSVDLLSFSDGNNGPLIISSGSGYYESKNGYVEKYTRGKLISKDGVITLRLYFDALNDDPGKVSTLNASKDKDTGLYSVMLPSPFGTILINPEKPPVTTIPPLGIPVPDIRVPLNTGTNIDVIVIPDVPGTPVPDDTDFNDYVIIFPDDSRIKPIYIMLNNPYGKTNSKGKYSGREFNKDKAGGPVQDLDWHSATIDRDGVDKVKLHTGRFAESDANKVMIDRLEKILSGELPATDTDKRFYTHEIRELERYRALGVPDGIEDKSVWNDAHTATLEDYKVNEKTQALYTPEAIEAYEAQEMRENQ